MKQQILIAEDDPDIVELLTLYLESSGYQVSYAYNGRSALELAEETDFALAIIDIMMPEMSGYTLIKELRKNSNLPVIILSAKSTDADRIFGLEVGADAYISKPFNPLEVVAYVKALCRRYCQLGGEGEKEGGSIECLHAGDLTLDLERLELKKRGESVPLTSTELKIMAILMRNPGRVFTKAQLYECVNGDYLKNDDKTMMVHIWNIRNKLEDDPGNPSYIKTVRGLGYKLEQEKR